MCGAFSHMSGHSPPSSVDQKSERTYAVWAGLGPRCRATARAGQERVDGVEACRPPPAESPGSGARPRAARRPLRGPPRRGGRAPPPRGRRRGRSRRRARPCGPSWPIDSLNATRSFEATRSARISRSSPLRAVRSASISANSALASLIRLGRSLDERVLRAPTLDVDAVSTCHGAPSHAPGAGALLLLHVEVGAGPRVRLPVSPAGTKR